MTRTNLTLQLDTDVIRRARVLAARRGTSISAMVAGELDRLVAEDERYERSRQRALEILAKAETRGGRTWTRDSLYGRVERHGR